MYCSQNIYDAEGGLLDPEEVLTTFTDEEILQEYTDRELGDRDVDVIINKHRNGQHWQDDALDFLYNLSNKIRLT